MSSNTDQVLLNAIQKQIQNEIKIDSFKLEIKGSLQSPTFNLFFQGPFIVIKQNTSIFCNIFLPNFLPLIDTSQCNAVLLLLNSNQKLQYKFIFENAGGAREFYNESLTVFELFQPLVKNINLNFCKIKQEFIVLMPNSDKPINADLFIGIEKINSVNHAILNVIPKDDSSKKSKKPKKHDKSKEKGNGFYLELKTESKKHINVCQPIVIPKALGENTLMKITTEVFQNEDEKCFILCKHIEESLNMILSIYFLSHSTQNLNSREFAESSKISSVFLSKPSHVAFNSVDQEVKVKVPVIPVPKMSKKKSLPTIDAGTYNLSRPKPPNHSETIIIPDEVSLLPKQIENKEENKSNKLSDSQSTKNEANENDDDFIIEFEEIIIENAQEDKKKKSLIESERLTRNRTNTLSLCNITKKSRSGSSMVRRGNIDIVDKNNLNSDLHSSSKDDDEIDYSFFTSNILSGTELKGNCENSLGSVNKNIRYLEEERQKAKKNKLIEDTLPDFQTFVKQLNPSKSEMSIKGGTSLNAQLSKSFEVLQSNSYDDHFISIKQSTHNLLKTDEIVKRSIDFFSGLQSETEDDNDFFDFFDFNSFPSYDQNKLKLSTDPKIGFIDYLVKVIEPIKIKKVTKLYSDTKGQNGEQIGQDLTAVIASIFINGLRGFEKVNDISSRDYDICNSIIDSIIAVSGTIPELINISHQLKKMVSNADNSSSSCDIATLASALAILLLNNGILISFLRTIQKSDEWVSRYYYPTSIIGSPNLINISIVLLTPLFCDVQFMLSIESSSASLSNQSNEFIDTLVKAPAQGFLEVDPYVILSMGSSLQDSPEKLFSTPSGNFLSISPVSGSTSRSQIEPANDLHNLDTKTAFRHAIIHQFYFGLKNNQGLIRVSDSQRQLSFIREVSSATPLSNIGEKNANAWKEFTETTKFLKNTTGMVIKDTSYVIDEFVSIGIQKKILHIWLLFLGVHTDIVNKYYYSNSTFADPYRLKFIIKAVVNYYKLMDQSTIN